MTGQNRFLMELSFAEAYRQHEHDHPALREVHCLQAQFPAVLKPIQAGDLFAGRISYGLVGFRHGPHPGEVGYFCKTDRIAQLLKEDHLTIEQRSDLIVLQEFWHSRTSLAAASRSFNALGPLTPEMSRAIFATTPDQSEPSSCYLGSAGVRIAGINLDFDKLLQTGVPGLRQEINHQHKLAATAGRETVFFEAMLMTLDLFRDVCSYYSSQTYQMAADAETAGDREDFIAMAHTLEMIASKKPASFREAIQLWWLWAILSGSDNFGRMDVYLGDFLANDLSAGILTENQALEMLKGVWRLINEMMPFFTGRVILGGTGRRNEQNADRFVLLALAVTQTLKSPLPQLSLRLYDGLDQTIYNKALDMLGEGCTFPILYNDEAFVPAMASSCHVSLEEAQQYVVSDCGEHHLEHRSLNSPNGNLNLAKALDLALHNGYDTVSGQTMGLATGDFRSFSTFDDLWRAYTTQVEGAFSIICKRLAALYDIMGQEAPFLFESLLYDDCITRGKGIFAGGARYKGILTEIYGTITAADSLFAVQQLVYDKKVITPEKLLAMLDADFAGYEREQQMLLRLPKYGNDHDAVDAMAQAVHTHSCQAANAHTLRLGLDWSLVDLVNVDGSVSLGKNIGATPDGRKAYQPLSNANNPTSGRDVSGPTALLNSLVKLDISNVGGQVQHFKCTRELFSPEMRPKLEALLRTYFAGGGNQLMVTTVNRGDLENAMREPENYQNLMVRVGGFSARFVTLSPAVQRDILARTLNH